MEQTNLSHLPTYLLSDNSKYVEPLRNKLTKFFIQMELANAPGDFNIDDEVMILDDIDGHLHVGLKPGMRGRITSIAHRYKGDVNEHFEIWVKNEFGKGRFNLNGVIPYGAAEELIARLSL